MALVGDIKDLPLADIIQINCLGRNIARLLVRYPVGDGMFYFQDGEIYDARLGQLSGVKAIYEALKYEEGAFRIDASVTTSERTIFKSWAEVLIDGMRHLDEQNAGKEPGKNFSGFDPEAFLTRQTQGIPAVGKQTKDYIGKIVNDKYRVVSKIKEGELGIMYKATHIQMDVSVAIKIMHPYLVTDQGSVERFRRGAHAAAKIHHPNAINVLDFGITKDETVYLAMEYLEGETFRERLQRQKRVSPKDLLKIIKPVCSALEAAHRDQIVHRDLKPENIMIYESGGEELVKVLDFGMAKLKSMGTEGVLTSHGLILGNHSYISPEICEGVEIDHRSDIYALGIILYEALTGALPFSDPTPVGMALKHIGSKPASTCSILPSIPESVDLVVMRALEKKPQTRQQSTLELAKELEAALSGRSFMENLAQNKANNELLDPFPLPATQKRAEKFNNNNLVENQRSAPPPSPPINKAVNEANLQRLYMSDTPTIAQEIINPAMNPASFETKPLEIASQKQNQERNSAQTTPMKDSLNNNAARVAKAKKAETANNAKNQKTSLLESNVVLFFFSALIAGVLFLSGFFLWQYFREPQEKVLKKSFTMPQLVRIPGGSFKMGRDEGKDIPLEQTPAHEVKVNSFFISKFEVTSQQYQEFVINTNYRSPLGWVGIEMPKGTEDLPVVNITWEDAQYYCQWLSRMTKQNYRLPTEEEWEFAARGNDNRLYPWGNDWAPNSAVFSNTSLGVSAPINSATLLNDKSFFGVIDLAGNVSEWTASGYRPYPGSKGKVDCEGCYTVRGGNFKSSPNELVNTFRFGSKKSSDRIGFRVVRE